MVANKYTPARGEDWYRTQYVEQGRSTGDIADELDVCSETVRGRLKGYGIELRSQKVDERIRNREWLHEQYRIEKRQPQEIAEQLGCSAASVHRWLNKHDIEKFGKEKWGAMRPASYFTNPYAGGYPMWRDSRTQWPLSVHRLLAVAEYGIEEVKGKHVHHKNGIPWDNRPDNIVPLDPEEHHSLHATEMHERGVFDDRADDGTFLPQEDSDAE